jgi:hypothetical protein
MVRLEEGGGRCGGRFVVMAIVGRTGRDWERPLRFIGSRLRGSLLRGVGGARGMPENCGMCVCGSLSNFFFFLTGEVPKDQDLPLTLSVEIHFYIKDLEITTKSTKALTFCT